MSRYRVQIALIFFTILLTAPLLVASPEIIEHVFEHVPATTQGSDLDTLKVSFACLKSTDPYVRLNAVQKLGDLGNTEAVDPLIGALGDENLYVRAYTAEALGKLGDSRAVRPLIEAMHDKESFVRAHVTMAMGELGDPRAVNPLFALLLNPDEEIKPYAAWALGELRDSGVVQSLCLNSLIAALRKGYGYEQVADAFRKMMTQHSSGTSTPEAFLEKAGGFTGAITVTSVRVVFSDRPNGRHGTVQVVSDLKALLTVDDVLTMTLDGIELFSEQLSSFQLVLAERTMGGPVDLVPAQYVHEAKRLYVRLCAVTGFIRVEAARVNLGRLDTEDGVDVALWRNGEVAVDNFDMTAGVGATLVFPIVP